MTREEKAIILQYMYEDTFDDIGDDVELIKEARHLALDEFEDMELDEANLIGREVAKLYGEVEVI